MADPVALAAIRDALDRAGLVAKQAVEIGVEAPWQEVMTVARITREESRARRGLPPDDALAAPDMEVVDAELVPDDATVSRPSRGGDERTPADRGDVPGDHPATRSGPPSRAPGRELMTMEEAAADAAAANRTAATRIARARRVR